MARADRLPDSERGVGVAGSGYRGADCAGEGAWGEDTGDGESRGAAGVWGRGISEGGAGGGGRAD